MIIATFIDDLERLVGIGIAPLVGILLLFVLALAGALVGLAGFGFKFFMGERRRHDAVLKARDRERDEHRAEVDRRLGDCESDREDLRRSVIELDRKVTRWTSCPHKTCPMRLPP